MDCIDTKSKKLFFLLLLIQVLIIISSLVGGTFGSSFFITFMRIILLVVAHTCSDPQWATLYSVFALLSAIYAFDPVGLFLTFHGQARSFLQNAFLTLAFLLSIAASYIGYLYSKELNEQVGNMPPDQNQGYNFSNFNAPNSNSQPQNNYYGGTNYLYQQPESSTPAYYNNNSSSNNNNQWRPFSGQGHSLQ